MTSRRNLDARKKTLESGNPRVEIRNPDASEIIFRREGRGQQPPDPAPSPGTSDPSAQLNPAGQTDDEAVSVCFTKKTLCQWLQMSERSWSRATALGLTPAPDLVVGRSPRWSPATISKWLRSEPRLPGRKGANHA